MDETSHLEEENRRLRRAIEELSILNEIASAISSTMSLDAIVASIIDRCVKHIDVEQGAVMLFKGKAPDNPFRTMVRKMDSSADVVPYSFGDQMAGWMLKNQKPLLVNDLQNDPRFQAVDPADSPIRSLLSVPLVLKGHLIGLLNVFNKRADDGFTQEDQRLLSIIAAQSAQVIEHARLYEGEQALLRMREELRLAGEIQMRLMPSESPQVEGFDIAGRCIPANHMGGDFFQYFHQDGKLAVAMADVTGHAMDAAVPVMLFSGILHRQMELGENIRDTFCNLNRSLHRTLDARTFVCFTMGELDPSARMLRFSNGGCPSPYHFQAQTKQVTELEVGAYPLGIRRETEYEVLETQLQPGDRIVFCSDGIIEADNQADQQFGFDRTAETIQEACKQGLSAEATIDRILEAVAEFKNEAPQSDDMTCVVVKMAANSENGV